MLIVKLTLESTVQSLFIGKKNKSAWILNRIWRWKDPQINTTDRKWSLLPCQQLASILSG